MAYEAAERAHKAHLTAGPSLDAAGDGLQAAEAELLDAYERWRAEDPNGPA
jgi:uncharacterized protein YciI